MAKKAASKSKAKGSAQKPAKNKTAAIVEVATANPDMPAKDAVAKIKAEYGLEVTEAYYQTIKSKNKTGGQPTAKKKVRRKGTPTPAAKREPDVNDLFTAKDFVDGVGGLDQARKLLDTLEEIRSL